MPCDTDSPESAPLTTDGKRNNSKEWLSNSAGSQSPIGEKFTKIPDEEIDRRLEPQTGTPLLDDTEDEVEFGVAKERGCCHSKYSNALKILIPCRPARKDKKKLPSNKAGFFNFLSTAWLTTLMWKAYKHGLQHDDIWDLQDEDTSKVGTKRLEKLWEDEKKLAEKLKRTPDFWRAAWRSVKTRIFATFVPSVLMNCLQFLGPSVLLKMTLDYVNDKHVDHVYGATIVIAVVVVQVSRTCLFHIMMVVAMHTATKLTGAIQGMIYKKLIRLKTGGEMLSAQLINIVTNDLERIVEAVVSSVFLSASPVLFSLNLAFSIYVIGPWAILGLCIYLLFFPVMGLIAKAQSRLRLKTVKKTDIRVAFMTEILNSLRLIKMYAWEEAFSVKVSDIRLEEMKKLQIGALLQAVTATAVPCVSVLAIMCTILGLTLTGNNLTAAEAFTIVSMFTSMQFTIGVLPFTVRSFAEGKVSLNRIQIFLDLPEHHKIDYGLMNNKLALSIKNASFFWEVHSIDSKQGESPTESKKEIPEENGKITNEKNGHIDNPELNNSNDVSKSPTHSGGDAAETTETLLGINLSIERGKLIGVSGSIGAGKSSLISAICGDMNRLTGQLQVNGRLALVTQQSWIFNTSLRENILVGKEFDNVRFDRVLEVCALKSDLAILPNGDMTEIGERGINLSGGQKQRVNLARAIYSDRDIYLLDDPLSAVDAKVAKHIFNRCIKEELADKTVLLVTHGTHFLEQCDEVIFMKNGRICERGTHDSLLQREGEYFNMMGYDSTMKKEDTTNITSPVKTPKKNSIIVLPTDLKNGQLTTEEGKQVGSISGKVYLKFVEVCGGWCFAMLILLTVVTFVLSRLFTVIWIQIWLDAGDGKEEWRRENMTDVSDDELKGFISNNPNLWIYQLVYGLSFVIIFVTGVSKGVAVAFRVLVGASRMHQDMFHSIMRASMSFIDATPAGRILNRFSKDMDEVDVRIPFFLDFVLQGMLSIISQAILVCVIFPIFTFPLLLIAALFVGIDIFMNAGLRELKRLESVLKSPVIQQIGSAASGLSVIRTFGRENIFINRFFRSVDKHSAAFLVFRLSNRWFTFRMDMMATSVIFSITLICVFTKGVFTTAVAGLALASINSICGFIPFLMRMKAEFQSRLTSIERIMEYAYEVESEAPMINKVTAPPTSWPSQGKIQFKNVEMRYRPNLPLVLKDLTVTINSCEKVGIIGRTGAGKSSLVSAVLRIVELESGSIFIDDIDVGKLGLHTLRSAISVIPQDPVLFQGTIRYNLDPFDEHDDEAVWLALERSHLKQSVQKLPGKLLSQVQASGENFSVGEKQLICLTRALLRHSKILILDEATASVDVETDHLIQRTIQEAFTDCTVITIAHRLNTVATYDRIMALDSGKLKEFDTPENLMNQSQSIFKDMMGAMGVYTIEHMKSLS